jgi:hypothetical protein
VCPYADRSKYLECCRKAGRKWYWRNHAEQLARVARYRQEKQAADPTFRVKVSLQTNFGGRLKTLGVKRPPALLAQIGCNWDFFVEHISQQFEPCWTWQNYGKAWVFHHLRPVADFDFQRRTSDVLLVNHWCNLRPLTPAENLAKGDTFHDDDRRQLEANVRKARNLGMTGRLPRQRTCRLNLWQLWLKLDGKSEPITTARGSFKCALYLPSEAR